MCRECPLRKTASFPALPGLWPWSHPSVRLSSFVVYAGIVCPHVPPISARKFHTHRAGEEGNSLRAFDRRWEMSEDPRQADTRALAALRKALHENEEASEQERARHANEMAGLRERLCAAAEQQAVAEQQAEDRAEMLNKQEREHKRLHNEIMLPCKLEVHNLQTLHQRLSHGLESRVGELEEEVDRMRLEVSQARRGWEEEKATMRESLASLSASLAASQAEVLEGKEREEGRKRDIARMVQERDEAVRARVEAERMSAAIEEKRAQEEQCARARAHELEQLYLAESDAKERMERERVAAEKEQEKLLLRIRAAVEAQSNAESECTAREDERDELQQRVRDMEEALKARNLEIAAEVACSAALKDEGLARAQTLQQLQQTHRELELRHRQDLRSAQEESVAREQASQAHVATLTDSLQSALALQESLAQDKEEMVTAMAELTAAKLKVDGEVVTWREAATKVAAELESASEQAASAEERLVALQAETMELTHALGALDEMSLAAVDALARLNLAVTLGERRARELALSEQAGRQELQEARAEQRETRQKLERKLEQIRQELQDSQGELQQARQDSEQARSQEQQRARESEASILESKQRASCQASAIACRLDALLGSSSVLESAVREVEAAVREASRRAEARSAVRSLAGTHAQTQCSPQQRNEPEDVTAPAFSGAVGVMVGELEMLREALALSSEALLSSNSKWFACL